MLKFLQSLGIYIGRRGRDVDFKTMTELRIGGQPFVKVVNGQVVLCGVLEAAEDVPETEEVTDTETETDTEEDEPTGSNDTPVVTTPVEE